MEFSALYEVDKQVEGMDKRAEHGKCQQTESASSEIILTGICHGEAIPHLDHIHLRHQFGDVLVVREGETKNLIFVRFDREQSSC